jgi:hypothetical protein
LNVPLIEIVRSTLVLLDPLVVWESDPYHLIPALNYARFYLHSFGLDVFFGFDVYLSNNRLSFLESRFVETDPYLAFRMCQMTQ